MQHKETADLLEKAQQDLAKKKARAKQLAEEAKPDRERLEAQLALLEELPQKERRQVLNAAGLSHISAAPKPITPLSGRGTFLPCRPAATQPIEAPETPAPDLVGSVAVQMAAPEHDKPRTRTDNLSNAMKIGFANFKKMHGSVPTARALFDWLATNDESGKITDLDYDKDVLTWMRSDGGLSDTSFKAFQGRFTTLKRKKS